MTALIPYTGLHTLERLRRDMDELVNRMFEGLAPTLTAADEGFVPRLDVRETADAIEVVAEVPGLKAEDIKVELNGDLLTISGEKRDERKSEEGSFHVVERRFGKFSRTIRLPVEVEREKIEAVHKDGVLTITLPKAEKATATTIEVKAA